MPELPELNTGGLTPRYAKVPLPESVASPRATSVNIDVESPSSPRSRAMPSQGSRMAPTVRSEQVSATGAGVSFSFPRFCVPHQRTDLQSSKPLQGREDNRPWSPMSGRSRHTTKTKATEKGTTYPALPESRMGEDDLSSPSSPTRSKVVRSKAPSSESPSQTKVQQSTSKTPSRKEPSNVNHGGAEPDGRGDMSPRNSHRNMGSTWCSGCSVL